MPIKLPRGLPAARELRDEGIETVESFDERPLRIALLNLMPHKAATEAQFARLIGATPFPVELTLAVPASYTPTTTPAEHLAAYYERWPALRGRRFDALIVTGAPVEHLPFEQVAYWNELTAILDWAQTNVTASLFVCWSAQAALYHRHRVAKHPLPAKMFGVFAQRIADPAAPLLRGFGDGFVVPVSRHTEVRAADLPADVAVLAESPESGLCLLEDRARRSAYMFNHFEYGAGTLVKEYERDRAAGRPIALPRNYFPGDDARAAPVNTWRLHAQLFFANWLAGVQRTICADPAANGSTAAPMMQWLLAERRPIAAVGGRFTDLLLAVGGGSDVLPGMLRTMAAFGLAPRGIRVHRRPDRAVLIECRTDHVDEAQAERLAHRLAELAKVDKVAWRSSDGAGGLRRGAGHHGEAGASRQTAA